MIYVGMYTRKDYMFTPKYNDLYTYAADIAVLESNIDWNKAGTIEFTKFLELYNEAVKRAVDLENIFDHISTDASFSIREEFSDSVKEELLYQYILIESMNIIDKVRVLTG